MKKQNWKATLRIINEVKRNENYVEMFERINTIIIITNKGKFEVLRKEDIKQIKEHIKATGAYNENSLLWRTEDLSLENDIFQRHI